MKKLLKFLGVQKDEHIPDEPIKPKYDSEAYWRDYSKGGELFEEGKWREAITCFTKALENNPKSDQAGRFLGKCYEEIGEYDQALQAYRTMKPHQWRRGAYRLLLARVLYKKGDLYGAQTELDASLKSNAKDHGANMLQGRIYEDQGRRAEAESHYRTALKDFPESEEAKEAIDRLTPKLPMGGEIS